MFPKVFSARLLTLCVLGLIWQAPMLAEEGSQPLLAAAPAKNLDKLLQSLQLTPEQAKAINRIRRQYNQLAAILKPQILALHQELEARLAAPVTNPAVLQKLMQQQLALQNQLQKASLDSFIAIKVLLTDSQRVALYQALKLR